MILTCPNCDTKFRVKDDAIGPNGRKVKCKNCSHVWHAMPDGSVAPAPPPPKPAPRPSAPAMTPFDMADTDDIPPPSALTRSSGPGDTRSDFETDMAPIGMDPPPIPPGEDFVLRQRKPKEEKKAPVMAWVILLFLLIGTAAAGFFFRDGIVAAYPPIAKIYGWIGLDDNLLLNGLVPSTNDATAIQSEEGLRLVITGQVTSNLGERVEMPMLRGALVDSNQQELHVWAFEADKPDILPGETVTFSTEVLNPPAGVMNAIFTLVPREELMLEEGTGPASQGTQN